MNMPHIVAVLSFPVLSLAVAGCDLGASKEPAETSAAIELPEATCRSADAALLGAQDQLMMDADTPGEATLPKAAWQSLEQSARDQIVNAVGIKAACIAARPPAEQPVIIRNEFGEVQSERVVRIYQPSSL